MQGWRWYGWIVMTVALASYMGWRLVGSEDKSMYLVGSTTDGHHQIELACSGCHLSPFGGKEVLQDACENCHLEELEAVRDSHPRRKFTDPANADRLALLDARFCTTCHREHQEDITSTMGVTVPQDVCVLCHEKIGEERATHAGLAFTSCASSGCHNFHDNTALYESFLVDNSGHAWLAAAPLVAPLTAVEAALSTLPAAQARLQAEDADAPDSYLQETAAVAEWAASAHALTGVNCTGCHETTDAAWIEQPDLGACASCHDKQHAGFLAGKHGMRLALDLPAMTPAEARIPMHESAMHTTLGCTSCHGPHTSDRTFAAVDACLGCHSSEHTLAYEQSPHAGLREQHLAGAVAAEAVVTCATCHMPRVASTVAGKPVVHVEHNQNANLRPSDKMLRSVCMNCHSLEFSIDALADPLLVGNNFDGQPSAHVQSVDMAVQRK